MKGVLKVSKAQIIEIERYCDEHRITWKQRIEELGLSHTVYYYTRGLLSEEELHGVAFAEWRSCKSSSTGIKVNYLYIRYLRFRSVRCDLQEGYFWYSRWCSLLTPLAHSPSCRGPCQ